ncbi:2-oxoglutarate dehydrogenase E1 component [Candidatus Mesenet endosymbiont of Agriotes lineatus]|uniref:2-oxoglutarate dehydrogenase E1 component n=1 Tax=Candidatus Mesenet endosymbiont of Agriotes lineatus TaxID=3077948 RepID=UPI0030CEEB0A
MSKYYSNNSSHLFVINAAFIDDAYQRYLLDDKLVSDDWKVVFSGDFTADKKSIIANTQNEDPKFNLLNFFRCNGHLYADVNPLKAQVPLADMMDASQELIASLKNIYCRSIGFEFMHISSSEEVEWLQNKIENQHYNLDEHNRKTILKHLVETEMFEQFLHTKFPGYKRFSIEGAESLMVGLEKIIDDTFVFNINEIVLGMAHRGRLSVLTKFMGKKYSAMISEFKGNLAHHDAPEVAGDVKYHLGYSCDRKSVGGKSLHLTLCSNPSHLEAVNPIVMGRVRAKQDLANDNERSLVLGVLIHGDAAFAGQGVVFETLSLSRIPGYNIGGIVHIIVNNQIGFTTNPKDARSTFYCSDLAKFIEAPILHVNGDDPEAMSFTCSLALEYRQKFKKDIVIDLVCYRRYGHNEGDEPVFTQPLMYKLISEHKTTAKLYAQKLIEQKIVDEEEYNNLRDSFSAILDENLRNSINYTPSKADWFFGNWSSFRRPKIGDFTDYLTDTGVAIEKLKEIGEKINSNVPSTFSINSKIKKILASRFAAIDSGCNIDWGTAEALAFGSLLSENIRVRLSGQDSGRGTFSHRHAKLIDQVTEKVFVSLNNIDEKQAYFEVIDSPLSEYAVMGFEYGYSLDCPNTLVLWEGQFGDFANGAQIIIDQFISSAETKWLRSSGLVLLLPHGYEGQGPEHSSARIERFLQLCAEDNMQVVNCSTPANYFYALRRQIHRDFRKPLIVFTPKSLLRHKRAVSNLSDFKGSFKPVITEISADLVENAKIRKLLICSGKLYYDLIETRESKEIDDIAIVRLEQFYPFPAEQLVCELKKYQNAEVAWCQEEPYNMGAWFFVNHLIEDELSKLGNHKAKRPKCIARPASSSPACGYLSIHNKEQEAIISAALDISK